MTVPDFKQSLDMDKQDIQDYFCQANLKDKEETYNLRGVLQVTEVINADDSEEYRLLKRQFGTLKVKGC